MSHSPMLNEWEMRSRVQTMNRRAQQMRSMRLARDSSGETTGSSIKTLLASRRGLAKSVSAASSQATGGALQVIRAWLGLFSMQSEDHAEVQ